VQLPRKWWTLTHTLSDLIKKNAPNLCAPAASRRLGLSRNWTCFVVRDRDGQQLAYVYFEDESG
jgi:hypothetical protein